MGNPGNPGESLPGGRDWITRKFADIDRQIKELGPSVARSFAGTVAKLQATVDDLATAEAGLEAANAKIAFIGTVFETGLYTPPGWTGNVAYADTGGSVTFTLDEAALVIITETADINLSVTGSGGNYYSGILNFDGTTASLPRTVGISPTTSTGAALSFMQQLIAVIPAGTHTVKTQYQITATGTASGNADAFALTVQVIGLDLS
ncbi:MAG TPA: hypothetical protein VGM94_12835 [Galbitalea sp.]|jgi:hypothetical protein